MQKYFLAIVPEGRFQEQVTQLKLEIRDLFEAKYALKSPAHITLKMPFVYNEAKEARLIEKLGDFLVNYVPLALEVKGVSTFGDRVIFLGVEAGQDLYEFQEALKAYCKKELNLIDELSDRNFHPHMTVAFKDIKKPRFQNILHYVKTRDLACKFTISHLVLLKRIDGRWETHKKLHFM
ncbi:2'-5' RNA ligase family protein [Algoriphagus sp. AGSA1]|uniref:2'-5' RNA ligase family protein n=1 Tax=Algoriphagus sp. AGSA1 TaxID=2907213 RepID=UPI001F16E89A|nr:2'-5' RNA ligase family protein [Algoriphagus sp. AGSA1]MCE7056406.1 2'-5' RNA ligase family protein [Algoriphagus sp. AGSA1]